MGREFSERDIELFIKLAPESGGNVQSGAGHPFPFILRPISHRFARDAQDFKERINRLDAEDVEYLADLILANQEELRSLDEEDIESFLELVEKKISIEKKKEITNHLGIVG